MHNVIHNTIWLTLAHFIHMLKDLINIRTYRETFTRHYLNRQRLYYKMSVVGIHITHTTCFIVRPYLNHETTIRFYSLSGLYYMSNSLFPWIQQHCGLWQLYPKSATAISITTIDHGVVEGTLWFILQVVT